MNKSALPLLATLLVALFLPTPSTAQVVQGSNFNYEGYRDVRTNGNDSTFGHGLTHRYVDGELRFLTIAHPQRLHEFRIAGTPLGGSVTQTTATWDLSGTGAMSVFNGIWFEAGRNRLWITSSEDYTAVNHPAKVTLISLGSNGSVSTIKTFFLNVPAKRVYGGCNKVPDALVSQLGGPYVCGWGGYTSLVNNGGGASIGPAMYAIPDPDGIANGATANVRTILDHAFDFRGVRRTIPQNYFDGGDPRSNPPTRPTSPPVSDGNWLSPNNEGLGWMVWGDSYYNTGVWIGTTYAAVASLCKGACWYQSGTLAFDGRQFELHTWNGANLGSNQQRRPDSLTELHVPSDNPRVWKGNITAGNIAGATYDPVSSRLYLIGFPFGNDNYTGRLFSYTVSGAGGSASPPSVPTDGTAPTVSVTAPGNGSTVSGTVAISATASDNTGVTGVWFTVNGTAVGAEDTSAPYQISVNSATIGNGSHTIRAVARDAAGNVSTSAPVVVTVSNSAPDTTAPTVELTAPSQGASASGTIAVAAVASDNVAVTSVQFTLNGINLGSADTAAPYSINWNTTGAASGTHMLRAIARDAAGNQTISAARTVTVDNGSSTPDDTSTPSVSMIAPSYGETVNGTVTVSASASDNIGVTSVQFTLNGINLGTADTSAPFAISWNTRTAGNGTHSLRAVARDAAGNSRTSSVRRVTVNNVASDGAPPAISLSAPSAGANVSGQVTVSANASDNIGVASVQFMLNGVNLGSPDTTAPYAVSWNTAGAANGPHVLSAIARDTAGNIATSDTRVITVANAVGLPPVVGGGCATPDPFAAMGGGTCHAGGWLPPGMVPPVGSIPPPPTQAPAPTVPSLCSSPQPGPSWTCHLGGWLPPGMIVPGGATSNPPAPTPSLPGNCTTARPGVGWTCSGGGWVPPSHPLAGG